MRDRRPGRMRSKMLWLITESTDIWKRRFMSAPDVRWLNLWKIYIAGNQVLWKNITSNYHYHKVTADSEETLDMIESELQKERIPGRINREGAQMSVQPFFATMERINLQSE